MKIEIGKCYKSKITGNKIEIIYYNLIGNFYLDTCGNQYLQDHDDLIEWRESKSGVSYLSVWPNGLVVAQYVKKGEVDAIACIRVEWKEGQFDD